MFSPAPLEAHSQSGAGTAACYVSNCGGAAFAAGLCSRHYNRKRTTGTTDDGPKAKGSLAERLWRQVDRHGPDECWPWIAKSRVTGYGIIGLGGRRGKKALSHRIAWELTHGPIPPGEGPHGTVVLHICDNRLCCNPAHLRLGTQTDNVKDMDAKGRRKTFAHKGEKHHNSRFTEADILAIRSDHRRNVDIAKDYGCARQVIGHIRNRKSWKHI